MKKKLFTLMLIITFAFLLSACSQNKKVSQDADSKEKIEIDKNLASVELTIPSEYVGETTQEELDLTAKENGYISITLNPDGSAIYKMTAAQHKKMVQTIATNINTSLNEMVTSGDYPTFKKIKANSDFTVFTITTTSTKLTVLESMSILVFYTYGGMYHTFAGIEVDDIRVDFKNATTGSLIHTANSSDKNTNAPSTPSDTDSLSGTGPSSLTNSNTNSGTSSGNGLQSGSGDSRNNSNTNNNSTSTPSTGGEVYGPIF